MTVKLERHPEGVLLPVKAQPGSRNSGIRGSTRGVLKVSVTQVAEKGKANAALAAVIADELGLRKSQVELASGPTAAQKRFLIRGIALEELDRRIVEMLAKVD
ncbi:MAG TPA: DUF167 family protein [Pirellulales bacterium]|jgi:hypothetical protein|nr:DUF167 family protein [Pirellulales bacterium]